MLEFFVEFGRVNNFMEFAIDFDPLEALLHQRRQILFELALAAAHDRRQQIEPGPFVQRQNPIDHLGNRLAFDRQARGRRIGHANAGKQQAHIVINLGHRANRGARIAAGGFLFNGNGRRQAVDLINVGLLHHFQELAGVGAEAFHIAPLAFCIDGIEGQ